MQELDLRIFDKYLFASRWGVYDNISHSYWKQICLKLPLLRPNQHLFVQIRQY